MTNILKSFPLRKSARSPAAPPPPTGKGERKQMGPVCTPEARSAHGCRRKRETKERTTRATTVPQRRKEQATITLHQKARTEPWSSACQTVEGNHCLSASRPGLRTGGGDGLV